MLNTQIEASRVSDQIPLRIDVNQYKKMIETGIIREGAPYELLDGLIVLKDRSARGEDPMTVGRRHRIICHWLVELDAKLKKYNCHVQNQNPLMLGKYQLPEPDGAVLRGRPEDCPNDHFEPGDIFCVFEIADSSLITDRTTKMRIYAVAGIPQYVLVNLPENQVEVFEKPDAVLQKYKSRTILTLNQKLALNVGRKTRLSIDVGTMLRKS